MPAKMSRSAPRPPFRLREVSIAVRTLRLSCRKAGKAPIFTPVRESSGESRPIPLATIDGEAATFHHAQEAFTELSLEISKVRARAVSELTYCPYGYGTRRS
jgi:hypothetical protein